MTSKWIPRSAIAVAAVIAAVGLAPAFLGSGAWMVLGTAAAGAFGAGVTAYLAWIRGLAWSEALLLSTGGFAVAAVASAGGAPGSAWWGLSEGWAYLVSSSSPVDPEPGLRVLPLAVAWWGTTIGSELLRRPTPLLPLVGPLIGLGITSLVSVGDSRMVEAQGSGLVVVLLVLVRPRNTGALGAAALVALAAPIVAPRLPHASQFDRYDLRQHQDRSWDPLVAPSPLVNLKASLKEGRSDEVAFRVHSDHPLTRWSLAVLDNYDGTVWAVGDRLLPVDSVFPADPKSAGEASTSVEYRLEIAALRGPWVPTIGRTVESDDSLDLRFHPATGTVAAPSWLESGDTLDVVAVARPELTLTELAAATAGSALSDELDLVPPRLRDRAGDLFEGHDAGTARVVALARTFVGEGFYDHGPTARPGHSLARLNEFVGETTTGYAEQYAAAAGLLTRIGDLPTRVVVGYQIPADRYRDGRAEVVGDDVSAWIEVNTVEHGWVPVDVTPDRSREPETESPGVSIQEVAVPNPPPPPPPPEAPPPLSQGDSDAEDRAAETPERSDAVAVPPALAFAGRGLGFASGLLSLAALAVVALKSRRRRHRRKGSPGERVIGAWEELLDGLSDAGLGKPPAGSPRETARSYCRRNPDLESTSPTLEALTTQVDRAHFSAQPPSESDADEAWVACDAVLSTMRRSRRRWERICMTTDPRSLWTWAHR